MGGERASTTRRREAGKICALCGAILDTPPWPGERRCDPCSINLPRHRVLMYFMHLPSGWHVAFLEADCRTSLRMKLVFAHPEKILDLAKRGGADFTSATRSDMQRGIESGRGGIWLNLTENQYRRIR